MAVCFLMAGSVALGACGDDGTALEEEPDCTSPEIICDGFFDMEVRVVVTVTDTAGEPVEGAEVQIDVRGRGTASDTTLVLLTGTTDTVGVLRSTYGFSVSGCCDFSSLRSVKFPTYLSVTPPETRPELDSLGPAPVPDSVDFNNQEIETLIEVELGPR